MIQKNILGDDLKLCNDKPMTGFNRNGCCETAGDDIGEHTICAYMTDDYLNFTKLKGNDLSTPRFEYGFPGLNAGDKWCLCISRWLEALEVGLAPPIDAEATNESVLKFVEVEVLSRYALDKKLIEPLAPDE